MNPAELDDGQHRLLDRFKEAGGVVDFAVFDCDRPEESSVDTETHRQAVVRAMSEFQRQSEEYADQIAREGRVHRSQIFRVMINHAAAAALIPTVISWEQFLGPRYDLTRQGLIVQGKGRFFSEFFYYSDPALKENILTRFGVGGDVTTGFAYAFSNPPYRLSLPPEEVGILFDKFLRFVVCGSAKSIVCQWPTDWSNYFDAGKEWWGEFLWSLSSPDSNRIVVIAASTTD